jgi:transposase
MRAYGMELRKRGWEALEEGETSEEVGERLGIDASCVRKWRKRVREMGTLAPGGERTGRKREFDEQYERALKEAVEAVPDASGGS